MTNGSYRAPFGSSHDHRDVHRQYDVGSSYNGQGGDYHRPRNGYYAGGVQQHNNYPAGIQRDNRPSFPGPSQQQHHARGRPPMTRGLHTSFGPGARPIPSGGRSPILRSPTITQPPEPDAFLPPDEYIAISKEPLSTKSGEVKPKLLVLDLNGALVYRPSRSSSQRRAYPRPFLNCFLQYLFEPEPEGTRPWEVFVWSSAQPHNVRHMVETCFGLHYIQGVYEPESEEEKEKREENGEGRLLGVWARDTLGLKSGDYGES